MTARHSGAKCPVESAETAYSQTLPRSSHVAPPLDGVPLALFDLRGQEHFEIPDVTLLLADRLVGEATKLGSHRGHTQHLPMSLDGGFL